MGQKNDSIHAPVLLQPVIDYVSPQKGQTIFDGTLGGGGYTRALAGIVSPTGRIIATDQDQAAIDRFMQEPVDNVEIHHSPFSEFEQFVERHSLDAAVLDLGISSDQLEDGRGISFQDENAPLDMRMNQSEDNHLTAWGILNTWSAEEIADALFVYGEEKKSRPIAWSITEQRNEGLMETVGDLIHAVEKAVPRRGRIHPATQTFQALRILVNDELGQLQDFLRIIPDYMKPDGRVVIVSFHSLEDRIVKNIFREWKQEKRGELLTKKPVTADLEELADNPRSRSAKLRAFKFM